MEALKIFNQGFFNFKIRRIKMTNLIINKIYENLIRISRDKDIMNDCKPGSKNLYKKEIKNL